MSKNYLELRHYFPELFESAENSNAKLFNATPNEATESYDTKLQFKPGFEEEEQTV
jgi:hypothetical protein